MSNFRFLPEKSNAKHLFVEITTDALKKVGIPKGANVCVRKARKFKVDELTAWKTPGGLRITYAFEDAENIVLYSPKDENLMDVFHKSDLQFLGRVMCVKNEAEIIKSELKPGPVKESAPHGDTHLSEFAFTHKPTGQIFNISINANVFECYGLKQGYVAIGETGKTDDGDLWRSGT